MLHSATILARLALAESSASWLGPLLEVRTWAWVLWSGLGVLTIALLVLMRTRWGQAQPLSKCIVLSLFAHILFMAFAYSTNLFVDSPAPPTDDPMEVTLVADGETDQQQPKPTPDQELAPWDRFPAEPQPLAPELDGRAPMATRPSEAPARQGEMVMPPLAVPLAPNALIEPTAPVADPTFNPSEVPPSTLARAEPTVIELPPTADDPALPMTAPPLPGPLEPQLDRRPTAIADASIDERPVVDVDPLDQSGDRIQRLAQLPVATDQPDAVASEVDDLEPTDDRDGHEPRSPNSSPPLQRGGRPDAPNGVPSGGGSRAAPRRLVDGAPLPAVYQLRVEADRLKVARRYGGSERSEKAVAAALQWLASVQSRDGRWDSDVLEGGRETRVAGHNREGAGSDADTAITGLALLAFLAAGHTHLEGDHRQRVQHGLEFLLRSQDNDGSLAGQSRLFARMYCHGMASLALSEAYAMTGDQRLRPFVERAVAYSVRSQHPTTGGWRYQPGDKGDMSQFGWQVMALKSAELSGVPVPEKTRAGMLRFLRSVQSGNHGGLACYRVGRPPSPTMTAEALTCRAFLELPRSRAAEREATAFVLQELPGAGRANLYNWYYATLGLFQLQGEPWSQWNRAVQTQLLSTQRTDGTSAGSWDPDTVWGGYGGRVYSTAMATLCLEVYYRYLPIYAEFGAGE